MKDHLIVTTPARVPAFSGGNLRTTVGIHDAFEITAGPIQQCKFTASLGVCRDTWGRDGWTWGISHILGYGPWQSWMSWGFDPCTGHACVDDCSGSLLESPQDSTPICRIDKCHQHMCIPGIQAFRIYGIVRAAKRPRLTKAHGMNDLIHASMNGPIPMVRTGPVLVYHNPKVYPYSINWPMLCCDECTDPSLLCMDQSRWYELDLFHVP